MAQNILITGTAGYIGGSILANFISRKDSPIKAANITAAVRREEQISKLSHLGVNVILLDVNDEEAVRQAVLSNKIDVVIQNTASWSSAIAGNLINALGERRKAAGGEKYYIQSSVSAVFTVENGWQYGEIKDSDPKIFEKEKKANDENPGNPVRAADVFIAEQAKAQGVTSYNIAVPQVYGVGTGEVRKLSVSIPAFIRSSIEHRVVHKFDVNASQTATHISDLVEFYAILVEKSLRGESIPSGEDGHYFVFAHRAPTWDVMGRIAQVLHARGLLDEPTARTWPSDDMAAECLGFPRPFIRAMATSSGELVAVNPYQLGWQPKWDEERFLNSMDDEVTAVQELDTVKPTIYESLLLSSK